MRVSIFCNESGPVDFTCWAWPGFAVPAIERTPRAAGPAPANSEIVSRRFGVMAPSSLSVRPLDVRQLPGLVEYRFLGAVEPKQHLEPSVRAGRHPVVFLAGRRLGPNQISTEPSALACRP